MLKKFAVILFITITLVFVYLSQEGTAQIGFPGGGGGGVVGGASVSVFQNWTQHRGWANHTGESPWPGPGANENMTRWIFDTGSGKKIQTNPVIAGGKVVFGGDDGYLYALDQISGTLIWKTNLGLPITVSPVIVNDFIYVATTGGNPNLIYKIKMRDGGVQTSAQLAFTSRPAIASAGSYLYIGSNQNIYKYDLSLSRIWSVNDVNLQFVDAAPTVYGDKVIAAFQSYMAAYKDSDGTKIWSSNFGGGGTFYSTPAASSAGGEIVAIGGGSGAGQGYYVRKISDGSAVLFIASAGAWPYASPAISGNKIVFTNNGGEVKVVTSAGQILWSAIVGGQIISSPVISNNILYVVSNDGFVYSYDFDPSDGVDEGLEKDNGGNQKDLLWKYNYGSTAFSSPAVSKNGIYFGSDNGKLYAIGPDIFPPAYSSVQQSTASPKLGENVTVSAAWTDNTGLSYTVLQMYNSSGKQWVDFAKISLSGTSAQSNFTWSDPNKTLQHGSTVKWKFAGYDVGGNINSTTEKQFVIEDTESPVITAIKQSTDIAGIGAVVLININVTDNAALGWATLETDESGIFGNKTVYGSPVNLRGDNFANIAFNWRNGSIKDGTTVKWRVYINDTAGNWIVSDQKSIRVLLDDSPPVPVKSLQSSQEVAKGVPVNLGVLWTDNSELDQAFLEVNEGGGYMEKSVVNLTGSSYWSNFTYISRANGGTAVKWRVKATDKAGNSKYSSELSFKISVDTEAPTVLEQIQTAKTVRVGTEVVLTVKAIDNIGLGVAILEINEKNITEKQLSGTSDTLEFKFTPEEDGNYVWKVYLFDSAGNSFVTDSKTFIAKANIIPETTTTISECAGQVPEPSGWSECINEKQTRVVYKCNAESNQYDRSVEERSCGGRETVIPIPIYYVVGGALVLVMVAIVLIIVKRSQKKTAPIVYGGEQA
ncbi:MAG: PQQ-binding-like beta-propeller repeat protein [Candidatus Aenigmarchaeota archaeon]|nr:PQQ-binding-like beta-propeller repeat protein [Candidatus Aenigmarchaeota archaeon]